MKRFLTLTLSAIMAMSLFAGCAKKADKPEDNTTKNNATTDVLASVTKNDKLNALLPANIKSAGKLVVGLDDAYPPMEYRDDKNVLVGFDVDLGEAIGKKLGLTVEWKPTAWDGIILALQTNKFDMLLSSLSITEERKKEIDFSASYIEGGPVIITKKDNTTIKDTASLNGKVIGVQLGTTADDAVTALTGIKEVKRHEKITSALQDLTAGRIEAVVADDQVGRYYVGLAKDKYTVVNKMEAEPFGIGFKKGNTELRDAVQKAIDELKAEGTLSKISQKWFNEDIYKK